MDGIDRGIRSFCCAFVSDMYAFVLGVLVCGYSCRVKMYSCMHGFFSLLLF